VRVARRFLISGRVQGVGFRYFAQSAAAREGIHGWARNLPGGGVLIGAAAGWFVGRIDTGGNITQTPAGPIAIGNVVLEEPDLGLKMRDFGGARLIGSERGLFVASAAGPGCGGR